LSVFNVDDRVVSFNPPMTGTIIDHRENGTFYRKNKTVLVKLHSCAEIEIEKDRLTYNKKHQYWKFA